MKELISMPMTSDVLAEYPGGALEESVAALGCDGLEAIWGGEDLPQAVPQSLHVGYHLTFWPDWLDFWRGDRAALKRKFGPERVWREFYGGPEGPDTLLAGYRADLERAVVWGAEYVVFHVSDVSVEEGYTYRWEHSHEAVIDAAVDCANALLKDMPPSLRFLVENQWWPGFTFTDPALTRRLLDGIRYEKKGIMLDTGHLMNANLNLSTQEEGAAYLHRMLDEHGDLCRAVKGIHLHQSLSGAYMKASAGALPEPWPEDYLERFCVSYGHILKIDTHSPWTSGAIRSVVERLAPDYLVHELSAADREARERAVVVQRAALAGLGTEPGFCPFSEGRR